MKGYTVKGLYNKYDKNHKERDALDYYSTPTKEVINILETLNIDFSNNSILEPCIGGGHMMKAIEEYCKKNCNNYILYGTDIKDRGYKNDNINIEYNLDFMSDDYPIRDADYVIMNPPYSIIEPFTIRALDIANKGVIMLARLQFLEGKKRYESIFKENPPTDVYVYVDRISCYKNGDESIKNNSAQAYAWFYWDKENINKKREYHFIFRK